MQLALQPALPSAEEMYAAVERRDASFEGVFFTAVRTTGVFCRPNCPARTPARENVEFFASARDAIFAGYRPCLRCRPLEPAGAAPEWLRPLLAEIEADPNGRIRDAELRRRGLEPERVRRWFLRHYGMTFQAFQRGARLAGALARLRAGAAVTDTALDSGFESLAGFNEAFQRLLGTAPSRSAGAGLLHARRILTPLGPMIAVASGAGLCLLEFSDRRMLEVQLKRIAKAFRAPLTPAPNAAVEQADEELAAYFRGGLREFTVPLAFAGSEFQRLAWRALQAIPYGETRSYGDQARAIGRPAAVRAVARANGDNPLAIIVPCHRVVGADGQLTGYGGGLWRKRFLLDLEQGRRRAQP
jgi:AraC family transcriptional regulator of adaptative response/methylated-DNA-[protein]-cysteine methyltransferase